jgi:hypothetical protein
MQLQNTVNFSGFGLMNNVIRVIRYFNQTSDSIFYPIVEALHMQSNEIQWEVLYVLQHVNPVSDMDRLIQRLRDDYYIIVLLYQNAIGEDYERVLVNIILKLIFAELLADEIEDYRREFNQVKRRIIPAFDNTRNEFVDSATRIESFIPVCSE